MKFGINLSSALPRPWGPGDEERLVHDCLKTGVLADQLGFDYFWVGEHHFLEEYHHISACEVFMGALAVATKNIRLAHGIMTLQPQMNHPIRAAERIALEDLLSRGRIDFGSGRGSGEKEWGGFEITPEGTKAAWEESLRAIVAMWKTDVFSWEGKSFNVPERNVIPKPAQKPHPPLWLACTNPDTQRLAGELGLGSIAFLYAGLEDVAERVKIYREGLRNPKNPISDQVNDCFAFFTNCVVDADEERARQIYLESSKKQRDVFTTAGWANTTSSTLSDDVKKQIALKGAGVDWSDILERKGSVVGDAHRAVDTLNAYADIGVDMTVFNVIPGISGMDEVERNLRYLAKEVIPKFRQGRVNFESNRTAAKVEG
jgi:alkanesulfonate monooxygenase SsuD/methylene tetrahydromethanopterin reductase-like flavin-dependent oxidoreductase (luciferase family)